MNLLKLIHVAEYQVLGFCRNCSIQIREWYILVYLFYHLVNWTTICLDKKDVGAWHKKSPDS